MLVSFLELQLLLLLTAYRDLKFYRYQVESMILSKDAAPLLGLISVHGFSVVYTRYSSIYHVSSPTYPPPIHPINPNLCASLRSSSLIYIASAFHEHLLSELMQWWRA